jgi:hypothetical protein
MPIKKKGVCTEALRWFRKAAEHRHAFTQKNIGCMYRDGKGVTQNNRDTLRWFYKAAEQGDDAAQTVLDVCTIKAKE